ncbi:hypothetical protein H7J51_21155 [Mycobacterium crocinum]|uniref:Lipoprotein n=1 Tax=Mycolicibacterium crocinum TaxID=388459 RepID=A0ABY3TKV4_9MYCO|nr:hypothetical protein [Mycolicibacterium crocinum]MCV7217787.1 hypothetical protein [Mycolicibacterium crocinum]ULN41367.1 hypothetical protein MI149_27945 [Mycolicibacterium crocinum]
MSAVNTRKRSVCLLASVSAVVVLDAVACGSKGATGPTTVTVTSTPTTTTTSAAAATHHQYNSGSGGGAQPPQTIVQTQDPQTVTNTETATQTETSVATSIQTSTQTVTVAPTRQFGPNGFGNRNGG